MQKRKVNKKSSKFFSNKNWKIWAITAAIVFVLLFIIAFFVAPSWNNANKNSPNIDKVIADLEKLAQNDADIAQFVEMLKASKDNGELASYIYASAAPTPNPTPGSCIFSNVQKDQICKVTFGSWKYEVACGPCLACNKPVIYPMTRYGYTFTACDYITGSDAKKCDNNCLSGIPIKVRYQNERKCVKIVKSDPKTTCGQFCIDSTGCDICQACVKDLITGLGECKSINVDDNSGHGDPNDGGYKGAGCSGYYKEGKLVGKLYTCKNGKCEEK